MYIPPHFKKVHWQHALIGAVFGGVIAYGIFMFMYGTMYEELLEENLRIEAKVSELTAQNKSLRDDQTDSDTEKKQLEIQNIVIKLSNSDQLRLDRLTTYQLEELAKEEIDHIIGKDLETVGQNARLLISTIENKTFTVDDVNYYLEMDQIIITSTLSLVLKVNMHP